MSKKDPFKYYKTSPEIIKLAVMYYVHFPLYIVKTLISLQIGIKQRHPY